ncbi:MAG: D-alanyl-D-alanine carboxypeptidase [Ruminococcaceae bacterium]|nr:D-alanyl-D-alanine carboxypeptidase [Oscillospiraceae bacterium]
MRKTVCVITAFFLCLWVLPFAVSASAVSAEVSAQAAVLLDMRSGRVYYEKNADERLSMASTTKMVSALVVLESGMDLDEEFTVDENAILVEGTSMGLQKGDRATLRTLCYGMLLASGNDAANAAAVRVGKTIKGFCALMNEKAEQLGLTQTHFATPSGLDNEEHYTTARELGKIAQHAMQNETFREICGQMSATVSYGNPPYRRTLYNHNRLLRAYAGTIGIKTGFTKKSGRCLVSAAQRSGVELICVTLNAPNDWNDHKRLYDVGFEKLAVVELEEQVPAFTVKVTGGEKSSALLKLREVPECTLLEGERARVKRELVIEPFVYAPVRVGDTVGQAVYTLDGAELARVDLVASENVPGVTVEQGFFEKLWKKISEWIR